MATARGEGCISFLQPVQWCMMDDGQGDYTSHCSVLTVTVIVLVFVFFSKARWTGHLFAQWSGRGGTGLTKEEMRKGPGERARLSFYCKVMGSPLLASTGRSRMASAGGSSLIGRW